jgi:hypothetical protein
MGLFVCQILWSSFNMWRELLIYGLILVCVFIFVRLGNLKLLNRKVLSLWQRVIVSIGLTLILVFLFLFGSVFLVLLFIFIVLITIIVLLFGGRVRYKKF